METSRHFLKKIWPIAERFTTASAKHSICYELARQELRQESV